MSAGKKSAKPRISQRQREVLEAVEACNRPTPIGLSDAVHVIPANTWSLGNAFQYSFWYEKDFIRFLKNLEQRGFIRIEKGNFIYITDEGKKAIGAQP